MGGLLGGSVVVESVFAWPGLGLLAFQSLFARDFNLLPGIFFLSACLVVLLNLAVDIVHTLRAAVRAQPSGHDRRHCPHRPGGPRRKRAATLSRQSISRCRPSVHVAAGPGTSMPNCLSSIIVTGSLSVATAILIESALSFLGLGDPNVMSWGFMIAAGRTFLRTAWWLCAIPGTAILLTVLAINLVGEGLNDALNPRLQR
jgi:hypothetical protein